jgi:NADH-quinone oxidoreductase subunit N
VMFRAVFQAGGAAAVTLGVIAAVNSVIAFFYYANVARQIWFDSPADTDAGPARVPAALALAIGMSAAVVLVIGVYPQPFARVGELAVPF